MGFDMTFTAIVPEAEHDAPAPESFLRALSRVFPGSSPAAADSVTLVALLDDGCLEDLIALGTAPRASTSGLLWSDRDWAALARIPHGAGEQAGDAERTLVPILLGPILYGAIDWRGPLPTESMDGGVHERAVAEFLDILISRVSE